MVGLPLDPGQLNHRLTLEAPQETSDGQGGVTRGWTAQGEIWAHIEPVTGPSFTDMAGGERAVVTHRIFMRHRSGVVAGQRLRKGARRFHIRLVRDPDESGRMLSCLCEEEAQ